MADRSPYTVKTLLLYLADLERREQTARDLPDGGGDPSEDPGPMMSAGIVVSRRELRKWPDVQRILRDCEAAGFTFDAAGMNQWVALVCKFQRKLPDDVADWKLDAFCDLADQSGSIGATVDELRARLMNPDISDAIADAAAYRRGDVSVTTKAKRPGRKKADYETVQREAQLAADWKRAYEAGTYKADFAKDNGMTVKKLDALLDRVAWRQRNSE
jgi:hypothetical protein